MNNKLKINPKGSLRPKAPQRSFDERYSFISAPATNLNSSPMYYIGNRVNVLSSSTSPVSPYAFTIMKFGDNLHKVYGNLNSNTMGKGNMIAYKYPNINLTVNQKGNYKLIDNNGKYHKLYNDNNGAFVKYNKQKIYL